MIKFGSLIVLYAIVGLGNGDLCQKNFTLLEFPGGILQEAVSLILAGTVGMFVGCPNNNPVLKDQVKFFLYNRNNPETPILLNPDNPNDIDTSKPIKIIVHGWTCSVNGYGIPEIRRAYLNRYDCNVIAIDWSERAVDLYTSAVCAVPDVGKIIATFLCNLQELFNVDLTQHVHMIGHSLGAQISGFTGQDVQQLCNKSIARISGLDPAGPLFKTKPPSERLDSKDAIFVDILHTNGGILGYRDPCGHADFFPNCGTYQHGCPTIGSYEELLNLPITMVSCNHLRSLEYWAESIDPKEKVFAATSCQSCPGLPLPEMCVADVFNRQYNVMGEDCLSNSTASKFNLKTNSEAPFARG